MEDVLGIADGAEEPRSASFDSALRPPGQRHPQARREYTASTPTHSARRSQSPRGVGRETKSSTGTPARLRTPEGPSSRGALANAGAGPVPDRASPAPSCARFPCESWGLWRFEGDQSFTISLGSSSQCRLRETAKKVDDFHFRMKRITNNYTLPPLCPFFNVSYFPIYPYSQLYVSLNFEKYFFQSFQLIFFSTHLSMYL